MRSSFVRMAGGSGAGVRRARAGLLDLVAASLMLCPGRATWSECGQKGQDATAWTGSRIVNGQRATKCEWRWQACLKSPNQRGCWCGGTLFSEQWVLTAAHCVADGYDFNIMLGEFDHNTDTDGTEEEITVEKIVAHPDYDATTMEFDFALVKLASPAPLNECIGTACLPTADMALASGVDCFITGWGTLSSGGQQPNKIQEAKVQTVSNQVCDVKYGGKITDDMLCAQGSNNGQVTDACQGDSGGPLVCQSGGKWYVHGATSWGEGCAFQHYPGIWARVTHQLDWIEATMNEVPIPTPAPTPPPPFPPGQVFMVVSGPCTMDGYCVQSSNYPDDYSTDEKCVIAVNEEKTTPLEVLDFQTEDDWDFFIVNTFKYSGSAGPDGVVPTTDIIWTSDYSLTSTGWKICPASHMETPPPTEPPAPTPAPPPTQPLACGIRGADSTPWQGARIVNGQSATACEWPWQVGLKSHAWGASFCGGTLLGERWVLTAAHCIDGSVFHILAGDFNLRTNDETDAVLLGVERVILHPSWDEMTMDFDFALVELDQDAPMGPCIRPACLPAGALPDDSSCYITGWGTLSAGGGQPLDMQEAMVQTLSNSQCSTMYIDANILSSMLCAQGTDASGEITDACQGDSGGPLVCDNGQGVFELHGVTSWGWGCADAAYPGVWGRVSTVLDWIGTYVNQPRVPTHPPTPLPPLSPGAMWEVVSGNCSMDSDFCITSPNFPAAYGPEGACEVRVAADTTSPIVAESFAVEDYFDLLYVNGWIYTGDNGPAGIVPTTPIVWSSDFVVEEAGWRLCPAGPTPAPAPTPPCMDWVPQGQEEWYDSDGPYYNCQWYAQTDSCQSLGELFENFNKTANEACCLCKRLADMPIKQLVCEDNNDTLVAVAGIMGGKFSECGQAALLCNHPVLGPLVSAACCDTCATHQSDMCEDNDGEGGVVDVDNYSCSWYSTGLNHMLCSYYDDDDFSASSACCACGGGKSTVPACPGGEPAECCDDDFSCVDGDDDWCCDGEFYCSNDGQEYASAMGGAVCMDDCTGHHQCGNGEFCSARGFCAVCEECVDCVDGYGLTCGSCGAQSAQNCETCLDDDAAMIQLHHQFWGHLLDGIQGCADAIHFCQDPQFAAATSHICCATCSEYKACSDVTNWKDAVDDTCFDYGYNWWCTGSGGYGVGWDSNWSSFDTYTMGGFDATDACCACGGGQKDPTAPPAPPGPPPATSKVSGSVSFQASGASKEQAEDAVSSALSSHLSVPLSSVAASASARQGGGRRLSAGSTPTTWDVAYEITTSSGSAETVEDKVKELASESTVEGSTTFESFTQDLVAGLAAEMGVDVDAMAESFTMVGFQHTATVVETEAPTEAPTAAPATPSPPAQVGQQQSQTTTDEDVSAAGTLYRPPPWCRWLWASWLILSSARRALR